MSNRLNPIFIFLTCVLAALLYWPTFTGLPIWDDFRFLFSDPVMKNNFSYLTIWKNFAWPLSVSLQKLTYSIFLENYVAYHALNFLIHIINSLLLYRVAKKLDIKFPVLFISLFLLHPVNFISVAWIIQFKTLICFTFSILTVLTLLEVKDLKKDFAKLFCSWIFFGLAVSSKSAALPLVSIISMIGWKFIKQKKILFMIPFLLFTSWGTYRLLGSPLTQKTTKRAELKSEGIKQTSTPESIPSEPQIKTEDLPAAISAESKPIEEPKEIKNEVQGIEVSLNQKQGKRYFDDVTMIPKTMNYYFWQSLLPIENAPVKGVNNSSLGIIECLHLFFLVILVVLTWKSLALNYLMGFYLMLVPFLGFIPAPFMNITWVSDQHLYLALPLFLLFVFSFLNRISNPRIYLLPLFLAIFFVIKDIKTATFYKNEISFYEESLRYDPTNVPVAYNLARAYLDEKDLHSAMNVVETMIHLGFNDPQIRSNQYFYHLVFLQYKFQEMSHK